MKIHSACKTKYNHEYIESIGIGVIFDTFTYEGAGYIEGWEVAFSNGDMVNGETVEEFISFLDTLKETYWLRKRSEYNKDTILLYTNDIDKVFYFLHNYDENIKGFGTYYFTFKDVFEFRDITIWNDGCSSTIEIAKYAQTLIDELFLPNKYFYITPTQSITKKIKKRCNSDIAKKLYPKSQLEYQLWRNAYFGGIFVANFEDLILEDSITVEYDRDSAYIYDLLIEKHLAEPLYETDTKNYYYYLENEDKYFSIMLIQIKHIFGIHRALSYLKDVKGKKLSEDKQQTLYITNTDLLILEKFTKLVDYEVKKIWVGKKDYLPRYVASVIEEEYAQKVLLKPYKNEYPEKYHLQKIKVNSIYGSTVKHYFGKFNDERNNAYLAPQWGILTSAYARRKLLFVASQLKNWYYSATDSIFCEDCIENATVIDKFNEECLKNVTYYCIKNGLDLTTFKHLGQFKVEVLIKKMLILGKQQYMYTTVDGKFCMQASGIPKDKYTEEEAYKLKSRFSSDKEHRISAGTRVAGRFNENKTSCTINGKTYTSNGSYYDKNVNDYQICCIAYLTSLLKKKGIK